MLSRWASSEEIRGLENLLTFRKILSLFAGINLPLDELVICVASSDPELLKLVALEEVGIFWCLLVTRKVLIFTNLFFTENFPLEREPEAHAAISNPELSNVKSMASSE
jgi:hypothetical protein